MKLRRAAIRMSRVTPSASCSRSITIAALRQSTQPAGAGHDGTRMRRKQFKEPVIPRQQCLKPHPNILSAGHCAAPRLATLISMPGVGSG